VSQRRWNSSRRISTKLRYDPQRLPENAAIEDGPFFVVLDRFGQIIIVNREGKPVVHFIVRRGKVAAWLPDGTCWGDAGLLGGAATPSASERIAEAIELARSRG
jgi:hypothetical protein